MSGDVGITPTGRSPVWVVDGTAPMLDLEQSLPEIRSHIPADMPLVLCDSLGTVTTLVRQNRGVGLIWDVPVLLADDVARGRFQTPIRPAMRLYALWRNDVLETRSRVKNDPMPLIIERLRQLGKA